MMLSWGGRERRQAERCKVDVPCKLVVSGQIWTGTTRDISLTGAHLIPVKTTQFQIHLSLSRLFSSFSYLGNP